MGTDTTLLDIFATPDEDPGSSWDVAGVNGATSNQTLIRKAAWESGNTVPLGSFGTTAFNSEWIVLDQNDFSGIGSHTVGVDFSVRELNRYRNLSVFDQNAIQNHPLAGEEVTFTAVVVSYPRSSGLATPTDDDNDGVIDRISRIHG